MTLWENIFKFFCKHRRLLTFKNLWQCQLSGDWVLHHGWIYAKTSRRAVVADFGRCRLWEATFSAAIKQGKCFNCPQHYAAFVVHFLFPRHGYFGIGQCIPTRGMCLLCVFFSFPHQKMVSKQLSIVCSLLVNRQTASRCCSQLRFVQLKLNFFFTKIGIFLFSLLYNPTVWLPGLAK